MSRGAKWWGQAFRAMCFLPGLHLLGRNAGETAPDGSAVALRDNAAAPEYA